MTLKILMATDCEDENVDDVAESVAVLKSKDIKLLLKRREIFLAAKKLDAGLVEHAYRDTCISAVDDDSTRNTKTPSVVLQPEGKDRYWLRSTGYFVFDKKLPKFNEATMSFSRLVIEEHGFWWRMRGKYNNLTYMTEAVSWEVVAP